jgi:acyl carrier protein
MDSLTFVAVLAQVEAVYDVEFQSDEILECLTASSVGELSAMVSRFVYRPARDLSN